LRTTSRSAFFTGITAKSNLVPASGPLFAPEKGPLTSQADFGRQVFFFYATHYLKMNNIF
jgi:hypothetical protein